MKITIWPAPITPSFLTAAAAEADTGVELKERALRAVCANWRRTFAVSIFEYMYKVVRKRRETKEF